MGKSEFPEDVQAIKKRWKVGWRDAAPQRLVDSNTYGKFYFMIKCFFAVIYKTFPGDIHAFKTWKVTNIKF